MVQSNCRIILLNVKAVQNEETGDRQKVITHRTDILGQIGEVGMKTYWSATANNIKLDCTFTIRRLSYNKEKYLYASRCIYEVVNTGKAKTPDLIQLNAIVVKENISEEMIEDALGTL